MEVLYSASSVALRLTGFLFLRVVPSPVALAAATLLLVAHLTTIPFLPATNSVESRPYRAVLLSLPTKFRTNAIINGVLVLMVLEFVLTPFLDPANQLNFSRVGALSSSTAKILVRSPDQHEHKQLLYRPTDESSWKSGPPLIFTEEEDWVHTVKLTGLWPNTSYQYALADLNRTVVSGPFNFRTFPDTRLSTGSHFRFIASSCITPNFPYVPFHGRTIKGFDLLARYLFPTPDSSPLAEFMLFLGDFIYSDVPVTIPDDKRAFQRLYRRNYQSNSFRKLYERLPIFHTYDDHEFKNNFAGAGLDPAPFSNASQAWRIYAANANYDSPEDRHYYSFRFADTAFFVLDTRRYRSGAGSEAPTMLGEEQLAALYAWLSHANSTASFKFIISSVPFTSLWGHDAIVDSWAAYAAEKAAILDALHSVPNVIIISGDRHEFASIEFNSRHMHSVHEYSTSPLNAFDIPFFRTLRMEANETVPRVRKVKTEDGVDSTEVVEVPKERVIKYMARGNVKWSAFEIDTRDLSRPMLRLEVIIGGKVRYREELSGSPVKLQSSNALGAFVTTSVKDVFNLIGINPSRWF
ncbi:PhoD-like phosphatase-domain-containing protein [Mycena amicta]|nr:PhoD-like phosphatase-domain-containing protein [Mycena amicta]